MIIYTLCMHNHSATPLAFQPDSASGTLPFVRPATRHDVSDIATLVGSYSTEGLMLPRTDNQIAMNIDNYVVAVSHGVIVACAALEEYSPSLAEVSSVAVARSHHGAGLGTQVVLGVERLARARNIAELFAISLSEQFFLSMDYSSTPIVNYPEKLARYDVLAEAGVRVIPKPCFQKQLGSSWQLPQLMMASSTIEEHARRAS